VTPAFLSGRAGDFEDFDGERSVDEGLLLNFCDDFRGGGLGGNGDKRFFFLLSFSFFSSFPLALVEFDEEDVSDSRNEGNPCASRTSTSLSSEALPMRLLVTGGRLYIGLVCRNRVGTLSGAIRPGDCEDIEVGVVSLL
jgi:hypothetical protein